MADMIEGVLLAGGLNKGRLSECTAEKWEAMIDINGHPMAAYVVKAFLESGRVSRVVVSGPGELETALAEFGDRVRLVRPGENLLDSLMNALDGTSGRKVLIGSADIPLINGEAIKDVIERCDADEAEVHYALVMKDDYERSYPGGKRTYINLKDGVLTGANIFMASREALLSKKEIIRQMYDRRKNPLAMAIALGIGSVMILKFLLGLVSVADIEKVARKSFKLEGRGIKTPYASIAMDVDKPSDLELARKNAVW